MGADVEINPSAYVAAFQQSLVPQALLDAEGHWSALNMALNALLGDEVAIGQPCYTLAAESSLLEAAISRLGEGRRGEPMEIHWCRSSGAEVVSTVRLLPLEDITPSLVLMSVEPVTAHLSIEGGRPSYFDRQTGLASNALFMDRLQQALVRRQRHGTELAVMMLSVDGYAGVGTQFGLPAADQVVLEVAKRLGRCVRRSDTLARLGGDTFGLVLEEVGSSLEAITLAAKICDKVGGEVLWEAISVPVSVSLGLTMAESHQDAWALVRHADQAMYSARSAGGNTYQLWP